MSPAPERVEIACFTFPGGERRGIATTMALQLVVIARSAEPGITVIAYTLCERNPSTRILDRLGFALRGTVVHPEDGEVWEWELRGPPTAGGGGVRR